MNDLDRELDLLQFAPAMEVTGDQLGSFMEGRKEFFNTYYDRVVAGMRRNNSRFLRIVSRYRDKYVEILSSPYMLKQTVFLPNTDEKPVFDLVGITQAELEQTVKDTKKFIKTNCTAMGMAAPDFQNLTAFRVLMVLIMRY